MTPASCSVGTGPGLWYRTDGAFPAPARACRVGYRSLAGMLEKAGDLGSLRPARVLISSSSCRAPQTTSSDLVVAADVFAISAISIACSPCPPVLRDGTNVRIFNRNSRVGRRSLRAARSGRYCMQLTACGLRSSLRPPSVRDASGRCGNCYAERDVACATERDTPIAGTIFGPRQAGSRQAELPPPAICTR